MDKFIKDGSIRLGGVCHRFQHDEAVEAYCKANNYEGFTVHNDGTITAWNALEPGFVIGFVF